MKSVSIDSIQRAVTVLLQGEVIAYPTEALYGLGCDPFNQNAVMKILQMKRRSVDKGFILVASDWNQLKDLVQPVRPSILHQVFSTWPGPMTWVFPAKPEVPDWIRGAHQSLALRVSAHPVVKALCLAFAAPIISTSANMGGELPIRDPRMLRVRFGAQLGMVVGGSIGMSDRPTPIKDVLTGTVLRN